MNTVLKSTLQKIRLVVMLRFETYQEACQCDPLNLHHWQIEERFGFDPMVALHLSGGIPKNYVPLLERQIADDWIPCDPDWSICRPHKGAKVRKREKNLAKAYYKYACGSCRYFQNGMSHEHSRYYYLWESVNLDPQQIADLIIQD